MVMGSSGASGTAATEGSGGEEGGSMEVSVQVEPTPGGGEQLQRIRKRKG